MANNNIDDLKIRVYADTSDADKQLKNLTKDVTKAASDMKKDLSDVDKKMFQDADKQIEKVVLKVSRQMKSAFNQSLNVDASKFDNARSSLTQFGDKLKQISDQSKTFASIISENLKSADKVRINEADKKNGLFSFTKDFDLVKEKAEETIFTIRAYANAISKLEDNQKLGIGGENDAQLIEHFKGKITELMKTYDLLKGKSNELIESNQAFTVNTEVVSQAVSRLGGKIKNSLVGALKSALGVIGRVTLALTKQFANMSMYTRIVDSVKNAFDRLGRSVSRTYKMLRLMVFRKILQGMIKGGLEGFQNLVMYSDETNATMSHLVSTFYELKNALAAMIAPLLNVSANFQGLGNVFAGLMEKVKNVANAINQVVSSLLGNSTWIKAKKVQIDYRKSLDKTTKSSKDLDKQLQKQLQDIDELNVLYSDRDSDSNTGDNTGLNPNDMFDTVPIEQKWKDFADWLKSMWEQGDFTELGMKISDWIKKALRSIDWDKIKDYAYRIGTSLATFFNGLFYDTETAEEIGKALAQALNTIFTALYGFVEKIDGIRIGKWLAYLGNALLKTIEWDKIEYVFTTGAKKLGQAINAFVTYFDFKELAKAFIRAFNIFVKSVYEFVSAIDFKQLGKKLGEAFAQIFKSVDDGGVDFEQLGKTVGKILQSVIDFAVNFLKQQNLKDVAKAIFNFFKGIFEEVNFAELGGILFALLAVKLASTITYLKFMLLKKAFEKVLVEVLTKAIAGAIANGNLLSAFSALGSSLTGGIGSIASSISTSFKTIGGIISGDGVTIASGLQNIVALSRLPVAELAEVIGTIPTIFISVGAGVAAAIGGWHFGQWINEAINGEEIDMSFVEQMAEIKNSFSDGSWREAFALWAEDIAVNIVAMEEDFGTFFVETTDAFAQWASGVWETTKEKFSSMKEDIVGANKLILEDIKTFTKNAFNTFKKWLDDTGISTNDFVQQAIGFFSNLYDGVSKIINNIISEIQKLKSEFDNSTIGQFLSGGGGGHSFGVATRMGGYATGGFPEDGTFFRASKGELIGKFDDGSTVVANNQQIVDGIADGVRSANSESVGYYAQMVGYLATIASKQFGISERDIFSATQRQAENYYNRTGQSAFI